MRPRIALAAVASLAVVAGSGSAAAAESPCPSSNPPNELVLAAGSGQTAQLGRPFPAPLSVQLANTDGCPLTGSLAGLDVDFDAPGSGAGGIFAGSGSREAVVGTDAQGIATAPAFTANFTAGSYTVDAHSDYGTVELYLTNTAAGVPTSIAATSGSAQDASVDSSYAQPLQARVTDANGNPVQGAAVSFAIVPGTSGAGATFLGGQPTATTDSNGVASSPPLLANAMPGRFTAVASVEGVTAVAAYSLDNHAAATTIGAVAPNRAQATVGTRFRARLQAKVVDANGQPLEGAAVTFAIAGAGAGAGASFLGIGAQATVLTDTNGIAISPPLTANTTAGQFTATATTTGAADPVSYALRAVAGPAATVTAGAASGESTPTRTRFPVPLAVTVADRYGNPVVGAVVAFAAPRHGASGSFTFRSRTSRLVHVRTNADGIAVAPRFTANRTAGGYIVTAAVHGAAGRASFALVNAAR
jgi:protocatechuate 3,4-dioxygenase beta subunit